MVCKFLKYKNGNLYCTIYKRIINKQIDCRYCANEELKREDEKFCNLCGYIIGSREYKTFSNSEDPEKRIYLHIYCYNVMKLKGVIS